MFSKEDFTVLTYGPLGTRYSFLFDENEIAPTVKEAQKAIGVKLADHVEDCSSERTDGLCEVVFFPAEEFNENTMATTKVQ